MMDDTTSPKPKAPAKTNNNNKRLRSNKEKSQEEKDDEDTEEEEEYDVEAWDTLSKSFTQVQTVLDRNRGLIQQVNENHQSKIPDNISKNVKLIREINGNISKVISFYSDLSANFSNIVSQGRRMKNGKTESSES
ncbi:protein EARLY FLOWERING 4-like [Melia azedarach]|uniref:Protein EARLY FLOWERING 4-like n=1 Tax=Melia azedarach TaxID=155640 RepID=A0ACC1YP92_MELAZ|nr:protein EARLY FLOWERING 4-like [Melia azedarach]